MRHLAVNRVKGGQTKAPAPVAAPESPESDTSSDEEE